MEQKLRHHRWGAGATAAQVLVAIALCGALWWVKRRGVDAVPDDDRTLWHAVLLMAVVVLNPRVLHYDMYLALFAAFVALALLLRLQGWTLAALVPAIFVPALIGVPGFHPWLVHQMYELCLVLAALVAGLWRLGKVTATTPRTRHAQSVVLPLSRGNSR
jgi:hypothetical protein